MDIWDVFNLIVNPSTQGACHLAYREIVAGPKCTPVRPSQEISSQSSIPVDQSVQREPSAPVALTLFGDTRLKPIDLRYIKRGIQNKVHKGTIAADSSDHASNYTASIRKQKAETQFKINKQHGLSLIELIITLSLMVTILAAGVPSFTSFLDANRLSSVTNEFVAALNMARSEAIKRNSRIVLRKVSNDGQGYEQGWIIFVDNDNDAILDNGEYILQVFDSLLRHNITLQGNNNLTDYILFTPEGLARTTAGVLQGGTVTVCKNSKSREINISTTGRIRTADGAACQA